VAIFPDDVVVADGDGAVVIPAALADDVIVQALEQEQLEAWIMQEVAGGVPLPGLYPPNAETRARYDDFQRRRQARSRDDSGSA
jgi:regulator of RNase E activity RraA